MSDALITRDDARLSVTFTEAANALKEQALAVAGVIGKVATADDNAAAFQAQQAIQSILSRAEKARVECKAPVLEYGRRIDASHSKFVEEIKDEMTRVSALIGDFQMLEAAKARAAAKLLQDNLAKIERERAEAEAKAKSHDQLDAIQEHFNNKAAEAFSDVRTPEPARADGQIIRHDWEITVTDIHKLYRAHANCVDLKPRLSEIKELLKAGVTPQGVIAKPIIKPGARVPRERTAIDV
jgi:hypothetical protein